MIAQRAMPLLFVLIWATGFIVARGVAPHAEPLTFLLMRYGLTAAVFATVAVAVGAAWPKGAAGWRDALVAGILIQGILPRRCLLGGAARDAGRHLGPDQWFTASPHRYAVFSAAW